MNKKEADKIRNSINICEMKLQKILPYLGDNKPVLNKTFNKLLIEKAVLLNSLKCKKTNLLARLAERIFHKQEKILICDYFKQPFNNN